MRAQPLGELLRGRSDSLHAHTKRLQTAEQQPARVGRRDDAQAAAQLAQLIRIGARPADDGAEQDIRVPAEVLRRAVEHEVGAVLERAEVDGRRGRRVDHHPSGRRRGRLEVGHRQERVRRCLEPHEVDAVRRRAGLVELDEPETPLLESAQKQRSPVVTALCERDRLARLAERKHQRRDRARA